MPKISDYLKEDRKRLKNAYVKNTKCYDLNIFSTLIFEFEKLKYKGRKTRKKILLTHETKTQLYMSIPRTLSALL
jgi:hypothetical protein